MDAGVFAQYVFNGLMLGMIYALVAVGFTLFFGVLNAVQFAHGDVLMVGAFTGLAAYFGLEQLGLHSEVLLALLVFLAASCAMALLGAVIGKYLVLPLKSAPPLNTMLITLMAGSIMREMIRLFFPNGSNPNAFPRLLPAGATSFGDFTLRYDSLILLIAGVVMMASLNLLIVKTRLGLAIRAVAQDAETAQIMGINFSMIVLITFALGSALAGFGGVIDGLYYNEINFNMGLLLGIIGYSASVLGGLGNIYGAIIGGFVFAALQTIGSVALPFGSAYHDVFAFAVVIILIAWKPTGLIAEKASERV